MGTALNLALNYGKNSPIAVQTSMHTLRTQKVSFLFHIACYIFIFTDLIYLILYNRN